MNEMLAWPNWSIFASRVNVELSDCPNRLRPHSWLGGSCQPLVQIVIESDRGRVLLRYLLVPFFVLRPKRYANKPRSRSECNRLPAFPAIGYRLENGHTITRTAKT